MSMDVESARERVAAEADRWCLRLHAPDCSAAERRSFERWRDAAPEHRQAYARAEQLWALLGQAVQHPQVRAMPEAHLPPRRLYPRRPAWQRWGLATAAALGLVAVAGYFFYSPAPPPAQHYQTAQGETRSVTLADNSTITLDTASRIAVRYAADTRHVELETGAAFFDVVPNRDRPFVVTAGEGRATVLGTRFQVRKAPDSLEVALLDGSVRLDRNTTDAPTPEAGIILRPGEEATLVRGQAQWQTASADIEALTAWRQGRLIFRDTPLADAVAQINRYNTLQLRIADPSLAALPVNGIFRVGDIDSFVLALENTLPLQAQPATGNERALTSTR